MLELHTWGPAFGLPSIDPECVAAISYLHRVLPPEQWVLVIAHNASFSPTGDFPLLVDSNNTIAGFTSIVNYLSSHHNISLDDNLSSQQRADLAALKSLLAAYALPLLDSTLYTNSLNYANHTRPAWTRILPTLHNYSVPPSRLESARSRAAPLGLTSSGASSSSATTEAQGKTPQEQHEAAMNSVASNSPSLLFKARNKSLAATLRAQQMGVRFRVESVAEDLLEPMDEMLRRDATSPEEADKTARRGQSYLLGENVSSIDCFIFGYMSLLVHPQWESNWTKEVMEKRYKAVAKYAERLRGVLMGASVVNVDDVMRSPALVNTALTTEVQSPSYSPQARAAADLPWRLPPSPPSFLASVQVTFNNIYTHLITPSIITPTRRLQLLGASSLFFTSTYSPFHTHLAKQQAQTTFLARLIGPAITLFSLATVTAFATLFLPKSIHMPFTAPILDNLKDVVARLRPEGVGERDKIFARSLPSGSSFADMGAAGDLLFGGLFGGHSPVPQRRPHFLDDDFDIAALEAEYAGKRARGIGDEQPGGVVRERGKQDGDEGVSLLGVDVEAEVNSVDGA